MDESRFASRLLQLTFIAICLMVAIVSFVQASRFDFDFHHFYLDGRYVWDHAALNPDVDGPERLARRQLPFYLPVVPLLLAPLTALGVMPAAAVFAAVHVGALLAAVVVLRRWAPPEGRVQGDAVLAVALLLALAVLYEAARFNQLSFVLLALLLWALDWNERGRWLGGGVFIALAIVLKLLPALFLPWLALKRQWRTLATVAVGVAAIDLLPCLIVFGPRATLEYHEQWWSHNVEGPPARGMTDDDLREHFIDHRNQSITATIGRIFRADHPYAVPLQPLQLSAFQSQATAVGVAVLLLGVLFWHSRRPQRVLAQAELRGEGAVYLVALAALSPLLRQYYLVWALPLLVIAVRCIAGTDARLRRLGQIACIVWLAGMAAWAIPLARSYGVHLLMLISLAGIVLATLRVPKVAA